jgi:hypothetical protein
VLINFFFFFDVQDEGEEFICGQLVDSLYGPKFVPGKVITLASGLMKFIPGVTDKSGRFVPGQILDTKG